MNNKVFSQMESKMISDYLKQKHKIPVSNSLTFWRKSPAKASEGIKELWDVKVTPAQLVQAAGRDAQ